LVAKVEGAAQTNFIQAALFSPGQEAGGAVARSQRPVGRTPQVGSAAGRGALGRLIFAAADRIVVRSEGREGIIAGGPIQPGGASPRPVPLGKDGRGPGDGGPAAQAAFVKIRSMAVDRSGNVFVADEIQAGNEAFRIRLINRGQTPLVFYGGTAGQVIVAPGAIDTIAGRAGAASSDNGTGSAVESNLTGGPPSMALGEGRLYLGLAGSVSGSADRAGFNGNDRPAASALLNAPRDVEAGANGLLYVSDGKNDSLRTIDQTGIIHAASGLPGMKFCQLIVCYLVGRLVLELTSEAEMGLDRITVDHEKMGGLPCIRDLRIPVSTIIGQLAAERTNAEILEDFPDLEPQDILSALECRSSKRRSLRLWRILVRGAGP